MVGEEWISTARADTRRSSPVVSSRLAITDDQNRKKGDEVRSRGVTEEGLSYIAVQERFQATAQFILARLTS